MIAAIFGGIVVITLFIALYRQNSGKNVYKYITTQIGAAYDKYAPYSFKVVREKAKKLGQEYTTRQYALQIFGFAAGAAVISYLYFYNLIWCIVYMTFAVVIVPYLAYLRCKRIYSEFVFEQIQVYATNVVMEFSTTQSFVKALEGVYESGVLDDPVRSDVKIMIDMAYKNGTIDESIAFMNSKYDYYIIRNMHQLFYQITTEGATDASGSLENLLLDVDMLVEGVYRDRMDRAAFHKKFLQFGVVLYFMIMLVQFLLGTESYIAILQIWYVQLLMHAIVLINTYFLLTGEKFYNENVGAE